MKSLMVDDEVKNDLFKMDQIYNRVPINNVNIWNTKYRKYGFELVICYEIARETLTVSKN